MRRTGIIIEDKFYELDGLSQLCKVLADLIAEKVNSQIGSIDSNTNLETNYTVPEIAKKVRRSTATITRHCRIGLINASKVGKSWLITEEAYQNYKNSKYY